MPRNLDQELLRRRAAVDDFINRNRSQVIDQGGADIAARRNSLLDNALTPYATLGGANVAKTLQTGQLDQRLGGTLASQKMAATRDRLSSNLNTVNARADMADQNLQSAVGYGRDVTTNLTNQKTQADLAEMDRQSALAKEGISADYQQRGLLDAEKNAIQPDYNAALMRSLFGLVGAGGTAYALNRYDNPYSNGFPRYTVPQQVQPQPMNQNIYNPRPFADRA